MSIGLQALPAPEKRVDVQYEGGRQYEGMTSFSDDLGSVIHAFRRRIWLFLAILVCVIAAAAIWLRYAVPIYSAAATIVLDPPQQVVPNSPSVLADVEPDSSVVDTQVQLLQSRVVLARAVGSLAMTGNPADTETTGNELIDALSDSLSVSRIGLSRAISIAYEDSDPEQAARVANAVAAAYLAHQRDTRQQATIEATQWLSESLDKLRGQVATAEAAVEAYRARSGLLVAKGATSTETEVTDIDMGLSGAIKELSEAEARVAGARSALGSVGANAAELFSTPAMQQLRGQYALLKSQRAQFSSALGASHPQMVELNRQIAELQEQMNLEARRTVEELQNAVAVAADTVERLQDIRDHSRRKLASDNSAGVELVQLKSKAESLRGLYEAMLARFQQTAAQESLGQVNATIVSAAVVPVVPVTPRKKVIWAGALAGGIGLGALVVLLLHLLDQTIVRPDELERRTGLPTLALVPWLKGSDLKLYGKTLPIADVVLSKPMSLFTESFRSLRVAVLGMAHQGESVVVQITSGTFAEGKTLCSIAFARTAALDGKRVLLVDADTRRRSLTECLGIETSVGLAELLRGKAALNDVIISGGSARRPHVLPLAKSEDQPYDLFSTKAFEELLKKLKKGFDVIVIDSAPVLAVAEPISIASRVDVVVLVTRWAKTPLDVVLKAREEIRRSGGHVIGTVLTHVDVKQVAARAYGRKYYPSLMKYYR